MPLGKFVNTTEVTCTPPLLDSSLFGSTGGYQPGRYCGLGSFEDGTTCCFPCPIQDWLYPPEWANQLRIPNYLSILSVILCVFLLLSFAVLPPERTHRHYLSVGLLFPVLSISLSFVIPVSVDPPPCYDAITPNDMRSSQSCAWTGALVTLGGLGCAIWVFLRSLWLHIRIFWDRDPGPKFKWISVTTGVFLPVVFLIAVFAATGFSYRMGQTCLPNHENAIVTFWAWLVSFAVAGFLLQAATTGFCVYVYMRTLKRERRERSFNSLQRGQEKVDTWKNVKKLMLLQWRNILVSLFTIIGSVAFFIVFWTQDSKLGHVFNDSHNIKPVKMWIICQTLSSMDNSTTFRGDKEECRKYVKNFTVPQASVLTSLILASLVGIEVFILLFRFSMLLAWRDLLFRGLRRAKIGPRPPTPQLTSLENPDQINHPSARKHVLLLSSFSNNIPSSSDSHANEVTISENELDRIELGKGASTVSNRPGYERMTSETELLPSRVEPFVSVFNVSSNEPSPAITPTQFLPRGAAALSSHPPTPAPQSPLEDSSARSTTSRKSRLWLKRVSSRSSNALSIQRTNSSSLRGRISTPVPGTFVHVSGATWDGQDESNVGWSTPAMRNAQPTPRVWENQNDMRATR